MFCACKGQQCCLRSIITEKQKHQQAKQMHKKIRQKHIIQKNTNKPLLHFFDSTISFTSVNKFFYTKPYLMDKTKEARLSMYDAVIAYCNNNPAPVASIPAFQSAFTDFQTAVSGIHTTAHLQADVITGIAADKKQMRIGLCQQAVGLCDVIFALASATGNNELKGKADFSLSDLKRLKGESLVSVCTNIFEAANANLAGLATYGITPGNITDFQNATSAYAAKITSPRNAVSQRASYAKNAQQFFRASEQHFKNAAR